MSIPDGPDQAPEADIVTPTTNSVPRGQPAGESAAWVLVETLGESAPRWVVAEGAHPKRFTRLSRTRLAGSATVAQHLPAIIEQTVSSREPQVRSIYTPSGAGMRVFAVPVLGPRQQVWAVQLWAGPRGSAVPLRPEVGALIWTAAGGGFVSTTAELERQLDSDSVRAATRTLPDLMRHVERFDDRAGFLRLFGDSSEPRIWSGTAVTAGVMSQARRQLSIAAYGTGVGRDRAVRAVVADISAAHPPPAPGMTTRLIRTVPIPVQHAIGLLDLRTGLVHEWISQGPPPLDRWLQEVPTIHPEDLGGLAVLRAQLLGGVEFARCHWRMRWAGDADWMMVQARWTVLTRGDAPQAMLDVWLPSPRRARPTRRHHPDQQPASPTRSEAS
ncbi:DUF5593 domain-containing protein [Nocardia amamiensis]|uniref:DUF5593 domain-containing protein n=1 Tax=Nocardia amamiensis TaxID=404578 RepID=A0ABS0D0W4_9NOCA|nr:GAF domain-containing protein [Nocardia amamiensis]MBF6302464.1 DUF5593 domain-containing protein [Nocardia amamiensis]